jgi:ElaB/YqjD/DUF883 family membrane-anchored ribosome-binding protein
VTAAPRRRFPTWVRYKADVKQRTADYVDDKREAIAGRASSLVSAADSLVDRVSGQAPSPSDGAQGMKRTVKRGAGIAQENPLGLAIGAVAAGFLLGIALPGTQFEDEQVGELADEVKDRARETGQEALERGRQVAQETAETAMQGAREVATQVADTARDSGREHGEGLAESARDQVDEMRNQP